MNRHKFAKLILLENDRSPFTLSLVELGGAVFVSILTWLAIDVYLSGLIPFGSYGKNSETYLPQVAAYRAHILGEFALPFVILAAISAISFVRSIRNDVRHFSRLGHLALALEPFLFLLPFGYFCFPGSGLLGLAFAVLVTLETVKRRKDIGNLIALPMSIVTILCGIIFWSRTIDYVIG